MSHAAIPNPAATVPRTRGRSIPTLAETTKIVTYGATLTGIYLSVGFLFYYANEREAIHRWWHDAQSLQKLFAGSFFASIPGDNAAWVLLGLLEASIVVLLARQPAARRVPSPAPQADPAHRPVEVALLAFGVMGLANNMIGNSATAIELFTYLGCTIAADLPDQADVPLPADELLVGGADE